MDLKPLRILQKMLYLWSENDNYLQTVRPRG